MEVKTRVNYGGSGWGKHLPGEKAAFDEVHLGDLLLTEKAFHEGIARNVARVVRIGGVAGSRIAYAVFVDPKNPKRKRCPEDHEFAIWDFTLDKSWSDEAIWFTKDRVCVRDGLYPA